MDISGTPSSAFAPYSIPPNADELLQRRIKEIGHAENKKIDAIKSAASAYRRTLEERLSQSKELEEADISVCHIRMQREVEKARQEIYQEKTVEGPIRILPPEMLSKIFRYHIVEGDHSPWTLAKVSKAWMETAMATPHLWCRMLVVSRALAVQRQMAYVVDGKKYYSVGNMQVCGDFAQLQAALGRSGAVLPLNIKVDSWTLEKDSLFMFTLLQILSSPFSKRIHDLDIAAVNIADPKYASDISTGPFPLLTSITLPQNVGPWTHRCLKSVSSTSRTLDKVTITGDISTELAAHSFWHRVKHVALHRDRVDFNKISGQLSALEHISYLPKSWPNRATPAAVWGNIRQISLTCEPESLHRLQLPRLETFTLYVYGRMAAHALSGCDQPRYPALVNLEVTVDDPLWPQYMAGAFPAVLNLTLKCPGDDGLIIAILKSVSSVRNVRILGPSNNTFGLQMLRVLCDEEPLVCPNLERLTLGNGGTYRVQTPKRITSPLCKNLVKFRRDIGKPLLEHTVHWYYLNEVVDYTTVPDDWEGLVVPEEAPFTGSQTFRLSSYAGSRSRRRDPLK
jgi:F-box-like